MTDFFLGNWSYLGIIVILILTGAGLPLPEEVPVIAAGVLSSHGTMDPWLAFFSCVIGALAGDTVMYWLGRHFGRSILRERTWWAKIIHPEREAKIEQVIKNHGLKVLFSARFLVGIRAPVYVAAGILHLPYRRFILMDLLCATTVVGLFFSISYWFGEALTRWIREAEYFATGLVALVALGLVIYFWRRHRRKVRKKLEQELDTLIKEESKRTSGEETTEEPTTKEQPTEKSSDSPDKKNTDATLQIASSPDAGDLATPPPTTCATHDRT